MMDPLWSETYWSTFKYFIILIVPTYYILCISWIIKCWIILRCEVPVYLALWGTRLSCSVRYPFILRCDVPVYLALWGTRLPCAVRYPFILPGYYHTWNLSKDFRKILIYQVSRKSIRRAPCYSVRTDGHDEANVRFPPCFRTHLHRRCCLSKAAQVTNIKNTSILTSNLSN